MQALLRTRFWPCGDFVYWEKQHGKWAETTTQLTFTMHSRSSCGLGRPCALMSSSLPKASYGCCLFVRLLSLTEDWTRLVMPPEAARLDEASPRTNITRSPSWTSALDSAPKGNESRIDYGTRLLVTAGHTWPRRKKVSTENTVNGYQVGNQLGQTRLPKTSRDMTMTFASRLVFGSRVYGASFPVATGHTRHRRKKVGKANTDGDVFSKCESEDPPYGHFQKFSRFQIGTNT